MKKAPDLAPRYSSIKVKDDDGAQWIVYMADGKPYMTHLLVTDGCHIHPHAMRKDKP